jgi:hypothetical protein
VIPLAPGHTTLLRFDFLGLQPDGVLEITGPDVLRDYFMPSSGMDNSFGARITNGRVIAITNDSARTKELRFLFFPNRAADRAKDAFALVTAEWLDAAPRAVAVRSLIPFEVEVKSRQPAFLETPKVYVPGYRATLNGRPAIVVKSAAGLVAVPVPAGTSVVRLEYPGTPVLRIAFWASAAGWIGFAVALFAAPAADRRRAGTSRPREPRATRS